MFLQYKKLLKLRFDDSYVEEENTVSSENPWKSPEECAGSECAPAPPCQAAAASADARAAADTTSDAGDSTRANDILNGNLRAGIVMEGGHRNSMGQSSLDMFDNQTKELRGQNFMTANSVSESPSMDVLSGGESDAGDSLSRRNDNNNSISTRLSSARREGAGAGDAPRRRGADLAFFLARDLLMTERTFKRDLELITVAWSARVSELSAERDVVAALARPCLALEPLALAQGGLLARLERALAPAEDHNSNSDEPEYRKIAELLGDYLTNTYDVYAAYTERGGALVGVLESARRRSGAAARACGAFEACAPLPLACLLLRPLHRLLHYALLASEIAEVSGAGGRVALEAAVPLARAAARQLRHVENHAALCQLQRDIAGYDKLLVAEREFIRLGCVYKHSSRGMQQKMLFLFNDVAVLASKAGSAQFRAHAALPLRVLRLARAPPQHSFTLCAPAPGTQDEGTNLLLSASNEIEFEVWYQELESAIENARGQTTDVDTELTPFEQEPGGEGGAAAGGALAHVCWHRGASLTRDCLHLAMRSQASGYLLRKFKNSHGWQKLWVVFAAFTLFFYKSWPDEAPLACLPLLGYTVGAPSSSDAIYKDFVFKLQFKNHVYFFRADSQYTYNRWCDVLKTAMVH